METALISVIIPVYMVENYLDRCVRSVVSQTYRNLEILLIDDGSPDRCGSICDEWAKRDGRIHVIHKKNGGLSDARNTGIDTSKGSYLAFVDSDDSISPDMLHHLYEAIQREHADMSICSYRYVDENGSVILKTIHDSPIRNEMLTGEEAIQRLCSPFYWYYVTTWNKLYRADLFSDIRFPVGKIREDEFVAHRLLGKCERIVCIPCKEYDYLQRDGSIMSSRGEQSLINCAEAFLDRAEYCRQRGFFETSAEYSYRTACRIAKLSAIPQRTPEFDRDLARLYKSFREHVYPTAGLTLKKRLKMQLIRKSPRFFLLLNRIVKPKKRAR